MGSEIKTIPKTILTPVILNNANENTRTINNRIDENINLSLKSMIFWLKLIHPYIVIVVN